MLSQPIDSYILSWEYLRQFLGPDLLIVSPTNIPHPTPTGAHVVAGPPLAVLTITGHTSARNHQGTFKNKIYYSQVLEVTEQAFSHTVKLWAETEEGSLDLGLRLIRALGWNV